MATLLREQAQVLLAKLETTYGVDATPAGADALFVRNISVQTNLNKVERNNITGFMGAQGGITTGTEVDVSFEVELAPSGTAGTAPHFGSVLRACGMAETVDSTNNLVTYTPIDAGFESLTFYWQVDGLRHSVTGARGQASMTLNSQDIPVIKFDFKGLYNEPTAGNTAPTGVDFSGINSALGVYKDTVPAATMFGEAVRLKSLDVNLGNDVQLIRDISSEFVEIVGRKGTISSDFHVDDAQFVSMMQRAKDDATGAMSFQLGSTAGNIFTLDVPNLQLTSSPKVSWNNSVASIQLDADIVPVAKNSDFTLTFK